MNVGSKILVVVHGGNGRGGAEKTTLAWCRAAQGLGYRVLLLTSNDTFDSEDDVEKLKCLEAEISDQVTRIMTEHAESAVKLYFVFVHAHMAVRCRKPLKHFAAARVFSIVSMRNDLFEIFFERNFKLLACIVYLLIFKRRISYFTFNSLEAFRFGKKILGSKVRYIPNLINRGVSKKHYNKSPIIKFLYLGRFENQKNIKNLLNAIHLLRSRGYSFNFTFVGEGSLMEKIKEFTAQKNLAEVINIEPYSSDICSYLEKADALLLTSYYEGFPNVLLEALSQNTFLICSPFRTGARELVTNERIGYLTKGFDGVSIADAMQKFIDQAPVQDIEMVKEVLARYNDKNFSATLKNLLETCT
jgi:glycosyltransferase involved in cell wall biosynthesis